MVSSNDNSKRLFDSKANYLGQRTYGTTEASDASVPCQGHSRTSREAAKRAKPYINGARQKVYDAIKSAGAGGLTDNEGIMSGVVGVNTWRARRVELFRKGYVADSGRTKNGCVVWVVGKA